MENTFGLSDLHALPDPEERTSTKTLTAGGKDWTITIHADGGTNATRFYAIMGAIQRAQMECGPLASDRKGLHFQMPSGKEISIDDPAYLGQLYTLELVSISPKFSAIEWATFGFKLGPTVMEELLDWAIEENGIGASLRGKMDRLKNALRAEESKAESSAPA